MTRMTRRVFLRTTTAATGVAGFGIVSKRGDAAEFTWRYVRSAIEESGLFALDKIWDNGYRQVTSSTHPINTPEDFKGFKIRVPPSPLWTSMFKAFGASPASINWNEVYSTLKTKFVEGQE